MGKTVARGGKLLSKFLLRGAQTPHAPFQLHGCTGEAVNL